MKTKKYKRLVDLICNLDLVIHANVGEQKSYFYCSYVRDNKPMYFTLSLGKENKMKVYVRYGNIDYFEDEDETIKVDQNIRTFVMEYINALNEKVDFFHIFLSTNRNIYLKYSQILTGSVDEIVDKIKKVIAKLSEEYHIIDYELEFMSLSILLNKLKEPSDGLLEFYYSEYGNRPIEFGDLL
ncbi:hypothetical protein [Faecalicoccus pleomorphus]|uniref:hypothetical protein n=1 Tax=Faecalicoccus pleomorphus TaxID=1323 RepID=UPI0039F5DC88